MARYAIVSEGLVADVVEWDGDEETWAPPIGATLIESEEASPGWAYEAGSFVAPPPPVVPPSEQRIASGYVTVVSASVSAVDGFGFSSVVRFSSARIRFYFEVPQPDASYIAIASVRHSADLQWRVSAKTSAYVEIRSSVEALEYGVSVSRIMR